MITRGKGTASIQPAAALAAGEAGFWNRRAVLAAVILLSMVPLLYPPVPPLVDLLGHMGRYRVQLDLHQSRWLSEYYGFHWAAIGNLGVDLLVVPLGWLVGLEDAVKLIVLAIPPLTIAGFLWVAREVHGRVPPTAFFALPFVYGFPFLFGFANFTLSVALAFLAFGLWLRLARLERTGLRVLLFVPISILIFFVHAYGWGVLGLLCFSAEAVRQHDRGVGWLRSGFNAALSASVMALPLLIMLAWRSETHGGRTGGWFEWEMKWEWVYSSLRDRWKWFDIGALALAGCAFVGALATRSFTLSRHLAFSALVLAAAYVLLPRIIFGSAYADMRLVPYVFAVALLAIRSRRAHYGRSATVLAVLGLAFFGIRIAATTASLAIASNDQQQKLAALEHVPMGARVASLVTEPCGKYWPLLRNSHLGALVIVRKQGFSNDQWVLEGMNLLELKYRKAGLFSSDPSEITHPVRCSGRLSPWSINRALKALPKQAFDYIWLIDPAQFDPRLVADLTKVAEGPGWLLFATGEPPEDAD
ncbi:MAG TPA: hypothetical protein VFP53_08145 [Sphingomicrobium sp.]|nr:hypothetical protein [Sphingomicrobium sp.]